MGAINCVGRCHKVGKTVPAYSQVFYLLVLIFFSVVLIVHIIFCPPIKKKFFFWFPEGFKSGMFRALMAPIFFGAPLPDSPGVIKLFRFQATRACCT